MVGRARMAEYTVENAARDEIVATEESKAGERSAAVLTANVKEVEGVHKGIDIENIVKITSQRYTKAHSQQMSDLNRGYFFEHPLQ